MRQLVIFAKTPELGRVKTRLQPQVSTEAALRLHRAFVMDTLRLALRAPADRRVVSFTSEPDPTLLLEGLGVDRQQGADLGERLADAARRAFAAGASRLVIVGTDSPDLPDDRVARAFAALELADVVLGPAEDGGYYLVGLAAPHLGMFERIAWSTDRVLAESRQRAAELGLRLTEIEPWFDVDLPRDLERLAREVRRRRARGSPFPEATAAALEALGLASAPGDL